MDSRNPLYWVLPAGVLAYVASPEVRNSLRTALVKGVAGAMDLMEATEGATHGVRSAFKDIVEDADKMRQEAKEAPKRVEVVDAEPAAA